MTPHEQGLLQAILAAPGEDAPRLIYADWCEEHGDPERAEFIRVQCEIAARFGDVTINSPAATSDRSADQEEIRLRRRERELLERNTFADFPAWVQEWWFTRGFVSRVVCTCADWLAHGPAIVKQHPVQDVQVSDKFPDTDGSGCYWYDDKTVITSPDSNIIPVELFLLIPAAEKTVALRFHQVVDAMSALETACLLYARQKVLTG